MKKVCIVSGCYNECSNIDKLYKRIKETTDKLLNYEWEILFADNCSTDGTIDVLRELSEKDKRVKVILNQANYGPDRSGANALFTVCADAVIVMASDLEDPPELISDFVKAWEDGNKVVMGQYTSRQGNFLLNFCRWVYYHVIELFSEYKMEENVTGFGLYDMEVIDRIRGLGEYCIVLRFLCTELGYKIKYIPFKKPKRESGESSYSIIKYYKYAMETLVLTSHAPLHLASFMGFIMAMLSLITALYFFVQKILHWYEFELGMAPIIIGIFFIGGVQLFFIGIIGEYLSSAIKRVTKRPFVIEKERINFEGYGTPGKYSGNIAGKKNNYDN